MQDIWDKFSENPWVSVVLIVCGTVFGCALVFGGVCCVQAEYQYKLKRQELLNQNSKDFFNKEK